MARTTPRKGLFLAAFSKYLARVFSHSSAPPHDANKRASARAPFLKHPSTAASKLPTNKARFTSASAAGVSGDFSSIDRSEEIDKDCVLVANTSSADVSSTAGDDGVDEGGGGGAN